MNWLFQPLKRMVPVQTKWKIGLKKPEPSGPRSYPGAFTKYHTGLNINTKDKTDEIQMLKVD